VRQPGAGRPISAAPPFGESHSDTPLFDDRSADPGAPADHRDADVRRASARLTAVPSVLDETARDRALDERSADGSAEDFHPDEFGRERRGGPAHRAGSPRDDATPVTPIGRTPVPGPTPIPLLRRGGGGRRSLAPVDSDGSPAGGSHRDSDFDPLHDPLSRPLMAPLLDPTPPLTGPIGLVEEPSPVAEESWSGDWLSGAWAERKADGAASDGDRTVEPERPAPRPTVRRAPRHRYLRTPDDPTPDEPGGSQSGPIPLPVRDAERVHRTAGDSGPTSLPTREPAARTGSGAIPMGSGSGTFDGPSGRSSAIPMGPGPSGTLDGPSGRSGAIPMGPGPSDEPSGRSGATPVGPSTSDGPSGRSGAIPMPAGGSAGSGAIPMPGGRSERSGPTPQVPPASRAIPMPGGPSPAATGRTPQSPTRPAIPMPGGGHEPDSRPGGRSDDRPGVDPALGLRPESLARLGEADLNLLARLQAELRGERRSGPDDVETTDGAPADGARPAGPERSPSNASGPNASGPNGTGPNGTGSNRSGHHGTAHHGTAHNGTAHHGPVANEPPYYGPGPDGPGEPGYNGSRHNGSGAHEAGPNGTGAYPAAGPRGP
ncbi:MAG TPA: hypothetical protein VEZ42_13595, partial [Pseudonocardia sp.]|nr:hypothetical protein [Pseudonocardia sp.]